MVRFPGRSLERCKKKYTSARSLLTLYLYYMEYSVGPDSLSLTKVGKEPR